MTPQVEQAVEDLRNCFRGSEVIAKDIGDGGAFVTIDPVHLGSVYTPRETWMKFQISFHYPNADIYPLFISCDVKRSDGQPYGEGIVRATFCGEPALQISRSSNHLNPDIDTAALKVTKVIQWLNEQ